MSGRDAMRYSFMWFRELPDRYESSRVFHHHRFRRFHSRRIAATQK
jgi:hypothetical protein